MQQFGASDTCCIVHGKEAATPSEGPLSLRDGLTPDLLDRCIGFFTVDAFGLSKPLPVEARPPDTSPGASSILRI